jgi:hypothetical protein
MEIEIGKILTETKQKTRRARSGTCIVNSDVLCRGRDSDLRHTKQPPSGICPSRPSVSTCVRYVPLRPELRASRLTQRAGEWPGSPKRGGLPSTEYNLESFEGESFRVGGSVSRALCGGCVSQPHSLTCTSIFPGTGQSGSLTHRRHSSVQQRLRGSCSDSSTSTVPVHVSTVPSCSTSAGSAGAALLFWAVGLGQWAAPQQRRRRLRCSIGVFCRLQAAQGGSEPDFCRRVDTSLLPRSRSVPQAIWPRARKLAAIGGKRREATLPVPCSLLRAAAACCLLLLAPCSAPLHLALRAVF